MNWSILAKCFYKCHVCVLVPQLNIKIGNHVCSKYCGKGIYLTVSRTMKLQKMGVFLASVSVKFKILFCNLNLLYSMESFFFNKNRFKFDPRSICQIPRFQFHNGLLLRWEGPSPQAPQPKFVQAYRWHWCSTKHPPISKMDCTTQLGVLMYFGFDVIAVVINVR